MHFAYKLCKVKFKKATWMQNAENIIICSVLKQKCIKEICVKQELPILHNRYGNKSGSSHLELYTLLVGHYLPCQYINF